MKRKHFTPQRIAMNAIMIALYVALSFASFIIFGVKFTFEELPVVISAVVFGPVDAVVVGFLGEFMNQMLTYGFTPTTLLWILPAVVRGSFIGFSMWLMKRKHTHEEIFKSMRCVWVFVICMISGILSSVLNTFAYYVDSTMFGYYNYHLVFGVFWLRLCIGMVLSSLMATVSVPVTLALKRARLIQ